MDASASPITADGGAMAEPLTARARSSHGSHPTLSRLTPSRGGPRVQTTTPSLACREARHLVHGHRLTCAPRALSVPIRLHPARFKAASCQSGFGSSVDMRQEPLFMLPF